VPAAEVKVDASLTATAAALTAAEASVKELQEKLAESEASCEALKAELGEVGGDPFHSCFVCSKRLPTTKYCTLDREPWILI
jgi:hypothetical protein